MLCQAAYDLLGNPRHIIFSESTFSFHLPTINTNKQHKLSAVSGRAVMTVELLYTPVEALKGYWEFELQDQSLFLTNKIKQ
jgi:hypothetical protein